LTGSPPKGSKPVSSARSRPAAKAQRADPAALRPGSASRSNR
jgi:hypothetical protein